MPIQYTPIVLGVALVVGLGIFLYETFVGDRPQAHSYQNPTRNGCFSMLEDPPSRASSVHEDDNNKDNSQIKNRKKRNNCSICLTVLRDKKQNLKELACGHAFHEKCIGQWLNGNKTCPICRSSVSI